MLRENVDVMISVPHIKFVQKWILFYIVLETFPVFEFYWLLPKIFIHIAKIQNQPLFTTAIGWNRQRINNVRLILHFNHTDSINSFKASFTKSEFWIADTLFLNSVLIGVSLSGNLYPSLIVSITKSLVFNVFFQNSILCFNLRFRDCLLPSVSTKSPETKWTFSSYLTSVLVAFCIVSLPRLLLQLCRTVFPPVALLATPKADVSRSGCLLFLELEWGTKTSVGLARSFGEEGDEGGGGWGG